jgi:hypothetical protein
LTRQLSLPYDSTGMDALGFIKDFLLATLGQMASLFLGIFIFGLLIQFISQMSFKSLANTFGPGGTYVVAWLGTPVHEFGHALFCLIFNHRIAEMKIFSTDKDSGTLGYVYHKWNPKNPYHVIGNFFIGIGPMILGCGVLFGLFYFLLPGSSAVWSGIMADFKAIESTTAIVSYLTIFRDSMLSIIQLIFTWSNLSTWQFWVFLYLSICVASNIRLSWADFKGSLSAIGCVILPFFILNLILMLFGRASDTFYPYTASALGIIYSLLILALILALMGFVIIYFFCNLFYWLRYRHMLSPFR